MTTSHKASLGLLVLTALTQAGAAHAMGSLDVKPAAPTQNAGICTYSYSLTSGPGSLPSIGGPATFDPNSFTFAFTDPNVFFLSGPVGFSAIQAGDVFSVSSTTTHLTDGTPATFAFSSTDAPQGGQLAVVAGNGSI